MNECTTAATERNQRGLTHTNLTLA